MNFLNNHRAALASLFIAFALFLAIVDRAPIHLEKGFPSLQFTANFSDYFHGVVDGTYLGPYVYRILMPYLVSGVMNVVPSASPVNIDFVLKILVLIGCQVSCYIYLRNFYPEFIAISGVFLLNVLLGFSLASVQGPSIIETSDLFGMMIFSLVLSALYQNSMISIFAFLFIGTINRETTWLLLPIIAFHNAVLGNHVHRTIAASLAIAIPYFAVRLLIATPDSKWFTFQGLSRNIPFLDNAYTVEAIVSNLHVVALLGPLIMISLFNFRYHNPFLRRASYIVPLFIVLHYVVGTVIETRLWMPLFIILVPLVIGSLTTMFDRKKHAAPL